MKVLSQALSVVGCAALGGVANFAFWFYLAGTDPDPTVGGAYAAVMALCLVPAVLVGTVVGVVIASRIK